MDAQVAFRDLVKATVFGGDDDVASVGQETLAGWPMGNIADDLPLPVLLETVELQIEDI